MNSPAVVHMQLLIQRWEAADDQRTIFLNTYLLMTRDILSAIDRYEFEVPASFDLLSLEWDHLSAGQRISRYGDYCHVNAVIGRTSDAVQEQVLEPRMPAMALLDKLLGPVELIVSQLIGHWRESVWHNVTRLLETGESSERARLIREIERATLKLGNLMV